MALCLFVSVWRWFLWKLLRNLVIPLCAEVSTRLISNNQPSERVTSREYIGFNVELSPKLNRWKNRFWRHIDPTYHSWGLFE